MNLIYNITKPFKKNICLKQSIAVSKIIRLCQLFILIIFCGNVFGQTSQTYSTPGVYTWTVPVGVNSISVECWGGGGSGGGALGNPSSGGGGAGGSYSKITSINVLPGQTFSLKVGSGGTGGINAGTAGEDSWFLNDTTILAKGGNAGSSTIINLTTASGASAISSGNIGTIIYYGGAGGTGSISNISSGGGGSSAGTASNGNAGLLSVAGAAVTGGGAGVAGITASISSNGLNNTNLGGAGSGAHATRNIGRIGGSGGPGKVVLTYLCPTYSLMNTSASNVCSSTGSTITLVGNSENLPVGQYTVTYNLSAPNALSGLTANMVVTVAGNGSFNLNNLSAEGTTTITITNISSLSGNGCNSSISANNTAAFMVTAMPVPIIEFTQGAFDSISNITACGMIGGGGQNDIDIASGNPGGNSIFQWQFSINAGATWINGPGPTSSSTQYVLNPIYCNFESVAGVYYFRAIITNGSCVGISNTVILTVTGVSDLIGGVIGSSQNYCISGTPSTLNQITNSTGAGGSATYTYQWQSSTDSINFSNISGATTLNYNPPLITQTTYYRRITVSGGCSAFSNTITILITSSVPNTPEGISGYSIVCQNSTGITYSINNVANATSYIWSLPNGWSIMSGAGTTSITVSAGGVGQIGNITVSALNICGAGIASSINVSTTEGSSNAVLTGDEYACSGTNANLHVTISGGASPYQIIYSNGINNQVVSDYISGSNIIISPATTTSYSLVSVSSVGGCIGTGNSGTPTVTITAAGTWLGIENNSWDNPNNWCGGIPTSTTNVIIPAGSPNNPFINSSIAAVNNLMIAPGVELKIYNQILKIFGLITSTGNINCLNGSIEMHGNSMQQSISGTMFYNHKIKNLRLSNANGISLSGTNDTLKVIGVLDFGASNVTLNTNGNLVMASTVTATSCVADMTSGGHYSGNRILGDVTVERYIPNHSKAWRLFSVPTIGQSVKASWQESNPSLANSTHPGYGTIITSNLPGATTSLGFDVYTPAGGTMKTYNSETESWDGIPSTEMTISNTKGYMLFVRGDRSVIAFNQSATATTLRTTGSLYTPVDNPPQVINIQAGKFESVGNPYASAIDFTKISKSGGIQDVFYVWDPELTSSQSSVYGLGGYQTIVNDGEGGVTIIPGGGSYSSGNVNILSGQAFLVHTVANSGQIAFSENCKTIENASVSRIASISPKMNVKFSILSGLTTILLDGVVSQFDDIYSNDIDGFDALKIGSNLSENIGILRSSKRFAMERRSMVNQTDTVFYNLGLLKRQTYQFDFLAENMSSIGLAAKLVDKFLGTSTPISLDSNTSYLFSVTQNPLSFAADRFYMQFDRMSILPVNFISVSAKRNDQKTAIVNWTTNNEISLEKYSIQRSLDGTHFESIGDVFPNLQNSTVRDYSFVDNNAINKLLFYRIKSISLNGLVQYSNIVKLTNDKNTASTITISPNPVVNKEINLRFNKLEAGRYNVAVYSVEGRLIKNTSMEISAGQTIERISLKKSIMPGNYNVVIVDSAQNKINILIQVL